MDIKITKLTSDYAEEYARFFDTTPHNDTWGQKCYCIAWRSDDSYAGDDHWYPTPEERRAKAIQFIKEGKLQGYLALCADKIVGWCNATADCRIGVKQLKLWGWPAEEINSDVKVKSIFCFVIAPEMRKKGIATRLVEHICVDAANEGYDFVEAYTDDKFIDDGYRGPLALYEKCGFIKYGEHEGKIVLRKLLRQ
ncbi:MAG: GNAT family N-acetyltransferase [Clostridiales bacterium]|nr:GNAT family N-acetyltransferase [Clostridiales bacterium]